MAIPLKRYKSFELGCKRYNKDYFDTEFSNTKIGH